MKWEKLVNSNIIINIPHSSTYIPEPYNIDGTNTQYLSKTDGNYVLRYDVALKNDVGGNCFGSPTITI